MRHAQLNDEYLHLVEKQQLYFKTVRDFQEYVQEALASHKSNTEEDISKTVEQPIFKKRRVSATVTSEAAVTETCNTGVPLGSENAVPSTSQEERFVFSVPASPSYSQQFQGCHQSPTKRRASTTATSEAPTLPVIMQTTEIGATKLLFLFGCAKYIRIKMSFIWPMHVLEFRSSVPLYTLVYKRV